MICPDCGHDNIEGIDACEACDASLVAFDQAGSELEQVIARHDVIVLSPAKPVMVHATMPVRGAIQEMIDRRIGCLLVQVADELVGIFTERDVLNRVSGDLEALDYPVSEFMTRDPETIRANDSIAYALHAMDLGGYRHMPIVDSHGKPVGIISIRDILRFLCVRFGELRARGTAG